MKRKSSTEEINISVPPSKLSKWLKRGKNVHILDIRPEEEREEWSIPESTHADLYQKIKSGTPDPFAGMDLPADRPVVIVCAAGKTSLSAAEKLRNLGIEAWSLKGGMKAWNFVWSTAEMNLGNNIQVVQVRRLAKGCLSYIVGSEDEAVVIDASLDPQVYMDIARKKGWTLKYVMDTHLHADYISRTRELAGAAGVAHLLYRRADTEFPFTPVANQQRIDVGNMEITVLHTPGHTPESLSFLIEGKAVFTGDTLFTDGVGRPDLKASREQAVQKAKHLYESLHHKLLILDNSINVFPAHIAKSMRVNDPVITSAIGTLSDHTELLSLPEEDFVKETVSRISPVPSNYQTITTINKKGSREGYKPEDLEAGGNRCAVGIF